MLTEKEQRILSALIEYELSTVKESIIKSDTTDPAVLEYIRTLSDIRRKLSEPYEKHRVIK